MGKSNLPSAEQFKGELGACFLKPCVEEASKEAHGKITACETIAQLAVEVGVSDGECAEIDALTLDIAANEGNEGCSH